MACINLYPTITCAVCKNGNGNLNTIASYATRKLSINGFHCVFVCIEMNLIVFSGSSNCVNTQYAALSGPMFNM